MYHVMYVIFAILVSYPYHSCIYVSSFPLLLYGVIGRKKTRAVADKVRAINPYAKIECYDINICDQRADAEAALMLCDILIAGTDNNESRFIINEIALKYQKPAIFGRVIVRGAGGDVVRVRPGTGGPCLAWYLSYSRSLSGPSVHPSVRPFVRPSCCSFTVNCCHPLLCLFFGVDVVWSGLDWIVSIFTREFLSSTAEQVSSIKQARAAAPAYVPDDEGIESLHVAHVYVLNRINERMAPPSNNGNRPL
jgi:hypothetical protein